MDTDWRWADPTGQQRLVRTDELRAALASGVIAPNTPVWRPGWKEWKPAYEVPELTTSALSAANGVVQNIPPPPLAMVAVQQQYEGAVPKVRAPLRTEPPVPPQYVPAATRSAPLFHTPAMPMNADRISAEPSRPSRPSAPPHARTSSVHAPPSHPIQNVMTTLDGPPPTPNRASAPHAPPSGSTLDPSATSDANTAVNLEAMPESRAEAVLAGVRDGRTNIATVRGVPKLQEGPPSTVRGADAMRALTGAQASPIAAVPVKAPALAALVRGASAPAPGAPRVRNTSKPPPPPAAKPRSPTLVMSFEPGHEPKRASGRPAPPAPPVAMPGSRSQPPQAVTRPPPFGDGAAHAPIPKGPPAPNLSAEAGRHDVGDDDVEELSGSILLADGSGGMPSQVDPEELSGSLLLADASGQVPQMGGSGGTGANDELSGSFLLDAGSTGALPSVESTGAILAAALASPPRDHRMRALEAREPAPAPLPASHLPAIGHDPRPAFGAAESPLFAAPLASEGSQGSGAFTAPAGLPGAEPTPLGPVPVLSPAPGMAGGSPAQPEPAAPYPPHHMTLVGVAPAAPAASPTERDVGAPASARPPIGSYDSPASDSAAPLPERSSARLHDMASIRSGARPKLLIPVLAVMGGLAAIGLVGLVVGALRKSPSDADAPAAAGATSASPLATAAAAPPPVPAPDPAAVAPPAAACTLGGAAHVVAPRAIVQVGVEVQQVGGKVALGFATAAREGMVVSVDPASLVATQTVRGRGGDPIRRVVPVPGAKGLAAAVDMDRHGDRLAGRRTVAGDPSFDLGLAGGGLSWAPYRTEKASVLWPVDGEGPLEALRAAPLEPSGHDAGWAMAFRRGTSIYAGAVSGDRAMTPRGPLVKVNGLGAQIGSPAIAAGGGAVMVVWADRAGTDDPWGLRWMRFTPGDASADAKRFVPPEGGLGEHAMSPAIAAAGPGRFLLVWTEGPVSSHQVRAQTLSAAGTPLGPPLTISADGVNAGQAQVAVTPEGRGVVAFLASGAGGKSYEVLATPVVCP